MNLGDHVGDEPAHVQRNRELLGNVIAQQTPGPALFLQQVHGVDVLALDGGNVKQSSGAAFDACVTHEAGVVCTIMVADCLPVLLAHQSGLVVGLPMQAGAASPACRLGEVRSKGRCQMACWSHFSGLLP